MSRQIILFLFFILSSVKIDAINVPFTIGATVYIFLGTECPLSQNYTLTLNSLYEKYHTSGIEFIGVFPVTDDSKKKLKEFSKKYGLKFKIVQDKKYTLTNLYKATITPEVIVIDSNKHQVYSGKIDNWAEELGIKRSVITKHFLNDALDSFINSREIKIPKTQAVGCFIHGHKSHQNHAMHGL